MVEDDIRRLLEQEPDHPLDALESDVWAGIAVRQDADRTSRVILTCQALIVAAALGFSLMAGSQAGQSAAKQVSRQSAFTGGMDLAPSTLLLGRQT